MVDTWISLSRVPSATTGPRSATPGEARTTVTSPGWSAPAGATSADRLLAVIVTVTIGMRVVVSYGVTFGVILSVLTCAMWGAVALRSGRYRLILMLSVLAAAAGVVLTLFAPALAQTSSTDVIARVVMLLALPATVGALVWCGTLVTPQNMAIAFGVGVMLGIPFNSGRGDENAWRFVYSLAVAAFVLAVVGKRAKLMPQLIVLGVLAGIGLLNDSRSNSSFLLLAGVVLLAQSLVHHRGGTRRRRVVAALLLVVATAVALYQLMVAAILEGAFGEATQQRTQSQIDQSGSLILGGRPELVASFALISRYLAGMGAGVRANYGDIVAVKEAMWAIGYDPNNRYVEQFMFGAGVEVHSMLGDFWLWFGPLGVALLVVIAWVIVGALISDFARGAVTGLFAYLLIRFVWDLAFSPANSAMKFLPLVLALALLSSQPTVRYRHERLKRAVR